MEDLVREPAKPYHRGMRISNDEIVLPRLAYITSAQNISWHSFIWLLFCHYAVLVLLFFIHILAINIQVNSGADVISEVVQV